MDKRVALFIVAAVLLHVASGVATAADRIILRNLEVLTDRTVTAFDPDGVQLDDGRVLAWDEIEKATVAKGQEQFDQMLREIGVHLYRVRQRLAVGDYRGLENHVEAIYPLYAGRQSPSAYMVCQACMWSRLESGEREAAAEPLLWCIEYLRNAADAKAVDLPGTRRLSLDPVTGLSYELPPVWFDAEAAKRILPQLGATIGRMKQPWPPAARVYYATLAVTADEWERGQTAMQGLDRNEGEAKGWPVIVAAQREIQSGQPAAFAVELERTASQYEGITRAVALYWVGRAQIAEEDAERDRSGLLTLLKLPAIYGDLHPELAAAGLYYSMQTLHELQDAPGSIAVRNELLDRFGSTHFGALVKNTSLE